MAINKVEYKMDSTTEGFAQAGDEVVMKKSNAKTIEEDVKEERTEELSPGQEKYLHRLSGSVDKTDYKTEGDESDLEGEEGQEGEGNGEGMSGGYDDQGPGAGTGVATMAQTGAALIFGEMALWQLKTNTPHMCAWAAPWFAGINVAAATMSLANAATFDNEYSQRLSEKDEEDGYAETLEEAMATLEEDIQSLNDNQKLTELKKLQAQYDSLVEEGKMDEADALLPELDAARTELLEGDSAIDIESIGSNNLFAHEFSDYSSSVAQFLKVGKSYGIFGAINSAALTACTAASMVMAVFSFRAANVFNWPLATTGFGLCVAASAIYTAATAIMINKTVHEFECGSKGNDLESKVNDIAKPLEEHDNMAEALGVFEEVEEETQDLPDENPDSGVGTEDVGTGDVGGAGSAGGSDGAGAGSASGGSSGGDSGGSSGGGSGSGSGSSSGSSSSSSSSSTT